MELVFLMTLLKNAIIAHFVFGLGVGIMSVFHPSFKERTADMSIPFKRTVIFFTALFIGSAIIPMMARQAFALRKIEHTPEWKIIRKGVVIGNGMTYKEAKLAAQISAELQTMVDGSVCVTTIEYATMTITIEFT